MIGMLKRAAGTACLVTAASALHAAEDVSGSQDPAGIERFPRAWIVEYEERTVPAPYEFVTAPVDKIRRDVRLEAVRVNGSLRRVTYRAPDDARLAEVVAHYQQTIGSISPGIVFSCEGQDCGRSTIWANDVFGVAELSAPNRDQFYLAAPVAIDGQTYLVAFYAVQRGNRRVYAHLDVVVPEAPVAFGTDGTLAESLARTGFAIVDGVVPDAVGTLTDADLAKLGELAATLTALRGETIHVVCHLYGSRPVDALTAAAERCATAAARALGEAGGIITAAHGLGPLAPAGDAIAAPRIELVLPYRLPSD